MPVWLNYDSKKAIITRFKAGSSSVGTTLGKYPDWVEYNFSTLSSSLDDDYSLLKRNGISLQGWDVFYLARDPVEYTISGYKHFYDLQNTNYFAKMAFQRLTNEYTFPEHVRIISDIFSIYEISRWRDSQIFLTHCVSMPIKHWRPWMNLVKLEKDFKKLHSYVGISEPFIHENKNITFNNRITIDDFTMRSLKLRWDYTATQWGYDLEETVERIKNKYS